MYCTAARGAARKKRRASGLYLAKKERERKKRLSKLEGTPIDLPEYISAKGLSRLLGVRTVDILKMLIKLGTVPRSSDEFLPPEVVDIIVVRASYLPSFYIWFLLLLYLSK